MAKLKGKVGDLQVTKPQPMKEKLDSVDMTRSDQRTYIGLALDSSGSMNYHYNQAVAGFNRQLSAIRKNVEHDTYVWLCLFGTPGHIDWPLAKGEVADLFDLDERSYMPFGSTPLLDAIGETIERLEKEDRREKTQAFLVMAFSDGEENVSQEWTWGRLSTAVKDKDDRWTFVFIGPAASHQRLQQCGFKPENMLEWKDTGVKLLMEHSSFALGRFLQARNAGKLLPAFFDHQERS